MRKFNQTDLNNKKMIYKNILMMILKFKEDMNEKASKKFFQELTPVIIPRPKSDDGE